MYGSNRCSIVNVVTDIGILALPIRYIFTLQLNVMRRVQISGIFLLGSVVCVFGIVRVVALAQAPEGDQSCEYFPLHLLPRFSKLDDRQPGVVRRMVFLRNCHRYCRRLFTDPRCSGYQNTFLQDSSFGYPFAVSYFPSLKS
jgi:hypothetical protein